MKFELLLSHWLRVTNIIYAALSSGVLAAVLAFPEFRRILFQSWLVVTDVFQLFLIILLFILLSCSATRFLRNSDRIIEKK